ncbi:hypothetical protein EST38_g12808 [Candolleomyces aberdarensis]|uniref:NACHT domain-containing protein n=1 Tax=Candolleomyces aberdarensis TaxID=2316362 RepID=A0A4Q2D3L3_9AGAR|nr:hypothetical protein EST38_g12808 [Candolleomyces aberdarensis]
MATQLFNNAHHLNIEEAHFNIVGSPSIDRRATDALDNARAIEATHTSNTASYAPKCKPGTREQILDHIMDWVVDEEATSMLWFQGPAGGGKTCIMREVATRCVGADCFAAAYFFSTRVGLDSELPFVATIVHQFITTIPELKPFILQSIFDNPTIFKEALKTQTRNLILDPLGSIPKISRVVIVVDGLDECRMATERGNLLDILLSLATASPHSFRIIIASRPEFDIRTAFDRNDFKVLTKVIRLQDYDGTLDIRNYFCDEFARIRETHPAKEFIPFNWPIEEILNILIVKASGIFVYPATIIKYIDNPRRNPIELLNHVLASSQMPTATNPFAELDALYATILHPPDTDIPLLKRLLHCIMETRHTYSIALFTSFFDAFLSLPPGTTQITLCDMHAIVNVPTKPDMGLRFHHKSLEDYLSSPIRGGDLYQARNETHIDLTAACFLHIKSGLADESGSEQIAVKYSSVLGAAENI